MPGPQKSHTKIFVSYSRKDAQWLEELQVHLKPLERESDFVWWDDTGIPPGEKWQEAIKRAIDTAEVAVLLISPNFFASDFIAGEELPQLLAAAEQRDLVILPVILSPSRFARTERLSQFQTVNDLSKPLVDLKKGDRDLIWVKLTEQIEEILKERKKDEKDRHLTRWLRNHSALAVALIIGGMVISVAALTTTFQNLFGDSSLITLPDSAFVIQGNLLTLDGAETPPPILVKVLWLKRVGEEDRLTWIEMPDVSVVDPSRDGMNYRLALKTPLNNEALNEVNGTRLGWGLLIGFHDVKKNRIFNERTDQIVAVAKHHIIGYKTGDGQPEHPDPEKAAAQRLLFRQIPNGFYVVEKDPLEVNPDDWLSVFSTGTVTAESPVTINVIFLKESQTSVDTVYTIWNTRSSLIARDDQAQTMQDRAVRVNVTANDSAAANAVLTIAHVTKPTHGTVHNNDDGTITYTPYSDYEGNDQFTYTVSDGSLQDTATVSVQVKPRPELPQLPQYTLTINEPHGARIYINGKPAASSVDLPKGSYTICIETDSLIAETVQQVQSTHLNMANFTDDEMKPKGQKSCVQ